MEGYQSKILTMVIILLVAAAAFGLGYLVRGDQSHAPIEIYKNSGN